MRLRASSRLMPRSLLGAGRTGKQLTLLTLWPLTAFSQSASTTHRVLRSSVPKRSESAANCVTWRGRRTPPKSKFHVCSRHGNRGETTAIASRQGCQPPRYEDHLGHATATRMGPRPRQKLGTTSMSQPLLLDHAHRRLWNDTEGSMTVCWRMAVFAMLSGCVGDEPIGGEPTSDEPAFVPSLGPLGLGCQPGELVLGWSEAGIDDSVTWLEEDDSLPLQGGQRGGTPHRPSVRRTDRGSRGAQRGPRAHDGPWRRARLRAPNPRDACEGERG